MLRFLTVKHKVVNQGIKIIQNKYIKLNRTQPVKLSEEECYLLGKLLKYGLLCTDLLHNYKNPGEDKDKMLSFFIIFVGLHEPKNLKDIFEINFKSLFDITLKYTKFGTEVILELVYSVLNPYRNLYRIF